jgi:hypothetical protein
VLVVVINSIAQFGLFEAQDFGGLVIFDRRDNALEIEERLKTEIQTTRSGRKITVIRA